MALIGNFRSQMLWDNIVKGDLSAVVTLLENGTINLEERDANGQTFLMVACQQGEISMVRELMEAGLDPNDVDNDNWSALLYAAKDGHLEIVIELIERRANIEHKDLGNWSALMWASYKGRENVVKELLDRGADPNVKAEHNMSCLCWASGRGHLEVVKALVQKGGRINSTDKYGTTPLIWASRKGYHDIVQELLDNGATVDNTGMDSLTALLVATKGGYTEVVQALLEFDPNPNAIDKDGFTALTIATKEGYETIVQELLAKDAYVNLADRVGDTILIHAVKGGNSNIVRALLNRYADVDVEGSDRKTALYWAVEKGYTDIVKLLLDNDAGTEIATKDGDTPLMKAVRNRHELIVRMLLDKGAKVSAFDKKGDYALHISLRARSKRITELLLRNPRNSRLLYRPNKSGETPYSIDAYHQKSILTQIHGHRQLNASDGENLLGYEIYSSSLADILSEPSLNTPITVGLYAKWGSGKSFLIDKLKSEMRAFTKSNDENQLTFTWSLLIFLLLCNSLIGSTLALALSFWEVGLGVGLGLFVLEYGFLGLIRLCSSKYNVKFASRICNAVAKRLQILALLLQAMFCNPVSRPSSTTDVPLVRFLFSENTKLTSVGGEKALAAMVAGLSEELEKEFGFFTSRFFSVFKHSSDKTHVGRFKTVCCIPVFIIVTFILLCIIVGIALLVTHETKNEVVNGFMIGFATVVALALIINVPNIGRIMISLVISQKHRIMHAAEHLHRLKLDGFMQTLKQEVTLMNRLVTCMDSFTRNTTRLVVVVDGLDTCEQEKVLQVLDIIHALFNEDSSHFVTVLAVDPQIIIKGIDQNLKLVFQDTSVNGFDYLRNIVHLPFYLQSQGLQVKRQDMTKSVSVVDVGHESPTRNKAYRHQDSTVSQISGLTVGDPSIKRGAKSHVGDSLNQIAHSNFDISHTLTKNDYFSDINPKSMRRLMNIVAVTGRLLRAYNIDFNWYRLAGWVNLVEQWPYRLSWIILFFEEHDTLDNDKTLKYIYDKIKAQLPVSSDVEPLLEIDRNVRKLEVFLASGKSGSPMLTVADLKKFLPCTINLDPYLRKLIKNLQQTQLEMPMGHFLPGGPPPGPPDMNKAQTQDSRVPMRPTLPRVSSKTALASMASTQYPGHMTPYGPMTHMGMMYPQMMHPYMMQYGPHGMVGHHGPPASQGIPAEGPKGTDPSVYITGYKKEILSSLTVAGVSSLLSRMKGINLREVTRYQQAVLDHNINGLVLTQCSLDELGKCLDMKFGDWQLFRSTVVALRDVEKEGSSTAGHDSTDSGMEVAQRGRKSSLKQQLSSNASSESLKSLGEELAKRSKMQKRSVSINIGKPEIIHEDESEAVHEEEEDEGDMIVPQDRMKRNDSVVQEMMYESGLLQTFMSNFTENISADDDSEEDGEDMNAGDLIDEMSPSKRHLPVQFTLQSNSEHDHEGSPMSFNSDYEYKPANGVTEKVPLLESPPSQSVKKPVTLLRQSHLGGLHVGNSTSDLNLSQISDCEVQEIGEDVPLIEIGVQPGESTEFIAADSESPGKNRRSFDSSDIMMFVDETRRMSDGGRSDPGGQQFTLQQRGAGTSEGLVSAGDQLGQIDVPPAQVIRSGENVKDGKTPESFV